MAAYLIDRQALISTLMRCYCDGCTHRVGSTECRACLMMEAMETIYDLPSAQPFVPTCDGCRYDDGRYYTDPPCSECIRRVKDCYAPER